MANSTHVLLIGFLSISVFFLLCRSEDALSLPHPSLGVFKERLGDYFPKSIMIPTVILLRTHELETPEITEDDSFLSYCPKPPNRLTFREDKEGVKYCYSETIHGEVIKMMANYECVNCVSFRTTVDEIRNEVMRSERRKKRFVPLLVAGAVGIGAAVGWMRTNWRMNGLEQKMQVIVDEVDKFGTSVISVQTGMIAVMNATRSIHADIALISRSLVEFQQSVAGNFSRIDEKLDSLQLEARQYAEYNIRMNFWRSFQLNYRFAKHRHDANMNAALKAMVGRPPEISILDATELWDKLQKVRKQLDEHLNYPCSFGDNVLEAFASAEVQHVMMERNGTIVLILTLTAFAPEKYDLFSLKAYPFPIMGDDQKIIAYNNIQFSYVNIAISRELAWRYSVPGRLKEITTGRFIDRRPDAQIVYSKNPSCESAIAFDDEENIYLCLLLVKEARIVRPKYTVTDTLWYFTGISTKIIELCPNQPRNTIITKPLTVLQPKCGCTYIDQHEASGIAYFNDRDICDVSSIELENYKFSNRMITNDELKNALAFMLQTTSFGVPANYNATWVSDLSRIARGESQQDEKLMQLIRKHTIQRQQDIDSLAEFRRKTVFDGNEHYIALVCGFLIVVVIILVFVLWCNCSKTRKMSGFISELLNNN